MNANNPAVVLVSGGMDSAVVLAIAREAGFAARALSVRFPAPGRNNRSNGPPLVQLMASPIPYGPGIPAAASVRLLLSQGSAVKAASPLVSSISRRSAAALWPR